MPRRKTWSVTASSIATNSRNLIRTFIESLKIEPNPEKHMIALSIGDPTVFGNLSPPQEAIAAVEETMRSGKYHGYAPSAGYLQARAAVAEYSSTPSCKVKPEDVLICSGCSCALDMCITALANPGQNILIPCPAFTLYETLAVGLGVNVKSYSLLPEQRWEVDLQHLESLIDCDTVAIVVNNPSNPCGSVYSAEHLKAIINIARRHCVPIIADEVYEHLVFTGETYYSIASLSDEVPVLSCSGLTKRFLTPGWRMGWIVIHDRNNILGEEIRKGLNNLSQRVIRATTLIQAALPHIVTKTPNSFFQDTIAVIQRNAQVAFTMISEVCGLLPIMPQGAMYMMIGIDMSQFPTISSTLEFVEKLVCEESVFCLPGECFNYPNYMRIVLTVPETELQEACHRINLFCSRYCSEAMETNEAIMCLAQPQACDYLVAVTQPQQAN